MPELPIQRRVVWMQVTRTMKWGAWFLLLLTLACQPVTQPAEDTTDTDNDGLTDSNHPLGEDYWFLPHMARFENARHILEVHDQSVSEIDAQRSLLERALSR